VTALPFAFALAEQVCWADGCGTSVRWVDARILTDPPDDPNGKFAGVRHITCVEDLDAS
jgi:hypothetical protein